MILTFKQKHSFDFSDLLSKARQIALIAVKTKTRSSAKVKDIGLKSAIANQILKKYSSKKIKWVKLNKVKLIIPNQGIQFSNNTIKIPCLKIEIPSTIKKPFIKINQIEIDNNYFYISVEVDERKPRNITKYIGVDLNATSHCAVLSNPYNGKVLKLGKKANHIHKKYSKIRKRLQKLNKKKLLKKIRRRESNIIKDLNHKISRKVVNYANNYDVGIKLENLKGIRNTKKQAKSFKYSLHSWSFYQLRQFKAYKAKLLGIPVAYIAPQYTSQRCSRCGLIGERKGKKFVCNNPNCEHVDHADANAGFNIAVAPVEKVYSYKTGII